MSTDNSELVDSETMALLNLIEQDMDGKWSEAMQTAITALQQSKPVQQEVEQWAIADAFKSELLASCKVILHPQIEGVFAVVESRMKRGEQAQPIEGEDNE